MSSTEGGPGQPPREVPTCRLDGPTEPRQTSTDDPVKHVPLRPPANLDGDRGRTKQEDGHAKAQVLAWRC